MIKLTSKRRDEMIKCVHDKKIGECEECRKTSEQRSPVERGVSVTVSCGTCRLNKRVDEMENHYCNYRGNFTVMSEDKPCENWLPSKKDLKIWLAR